MDWQDLGELADPLAFRDPVNIAGIPAASLRMWVTNMLRIRRAEEQIAYASEKGLVVGPVHLAIGQEAAAVGVAHCLRREDRAFGAHRSHSHYLALGGGLEELFAEVLGRETGCSRGMGGSMHLHAHSIGLHGTVPIVAGTISIAVGAALAARKDGKGDVAVAFFGDGATEEGVLHESLNLAAVWQLPILFACENNLFSSHLHISLRQPASRVARFADAHRMTAKTVDGNDVATVAASAGVLIDNMRSGGGPAFLESVTYRWRGHVGHREDDDVGVDRGVTLPLWKERDPIGRLVSSMITTGVMTDSEYRAIDDEVTAGVQDAWMRAASAPYPMPSALLDRVFAAPDDV